ncbi:MAG TPA: TraB/GumN family protein [Flavobacteriales bacterium]|nr:TraB/GumN family protein [Flavobacteriales bacterium]
MKWIVLAGFVTTFSSAFSQGTPKSTLWRLARPDLPGTSYLFGTVHSKDDRAFQWSDSLLPALERVQLVAGELDLTQGPGQLMEVMPLARLPEGRTLESYYKKREWKVVNAAIKEKLGPLGGLVSRLKPFFVMVLLSGSEISGSHERVLDDEILHLAKENGQEVIGLETAREQLAALDVLPAEEQARLLLDFVREGGAGNEMNAMLDAYAEQDLDKMVSIMGSSRSMPAKMESAMLIDRNVRMAHRMDSIITTGATAFFAVGAGHLPTNTGVIALLRAMGYVAEPVFGTAVRRVEPGSNSVKGR